MTEKRWLTKDQRRVLTPHSEHFENMALFIRESTDDELMELRDACCACTQINCGWSLYAAAQYLLVEIATEVGVRARRAKETAA
ncbi:hypothetical protein [Bradyrhizobium sp. Arg816]|uniref:hypothetical protein n=1 Tax=Bradyrhizobium sp. Arg816 TaxID=2998491 RepID=UPI00249D9C4C|nr:hypothetical protein [Bradyrhizobium sp. Arg816]MDI3563578.1 hypothetical protein [Bradyrhizobium sp. Arg816]